MTGKTISIVIPYYNDRIHVRRCLQSVKSAMDQLPDHCPRPDIVLVDDHSPEPFDERTPPVPLSVIRLSRNSGVGAARNKGASLCRGSHILFLDSDVMIDPKHLLFLYGLLEKGDEKIIEGPTSVIPANENASLFQRYMAAAWNYYEHENWRVSVFTQCFLIEKRFFNELGGFSERYARSGGEEFELGLRLNTLAPGFIRFDEQLVHVHHFDRLTKRMKKVFLRSRHIGAIALGMPNLPFRFTAQALMRSAYALVLNGFLLLALVKPLFGLAGYGLSSFLFYVSDQSFSTAMEKTHSRKIAVISVVFRQLEYTFINLGMVRGLFSQKRNLAS
jgi:glycosyltransferase involved in cell wall biosynthesis